MDREVSFAFRIFSVLAALCCLSHFSSHLGGAEFDSLAWWSAAAVIVVALLLLERVTVSRLLLLATVQVTHTLVDAPYNPDHWLLQFFVNVCILASAARLYFRSGTVEPAALFRQFVPAARWVFLICYGFAAFCKYNSHFLSGDLSCATALAHVQMEVSPWLKMIIRPEHACWMTLICESAVPLLLLPSRLRRWGILLGLVFHTMLVVSPAIAVFDFTITVYTMLFLFRPLPIARQVQAIRDWMTAPNAPESSPPSAIRRGLLVVAGALMIGLSASGTALYEPNIVVLALWLINMFIAVVSILTTGFALFGKTKDPNDGNDGNNTTSNPLEAIGFRPRNFVHVVVLGLALLNGLCPYIGLKTKGSFTMFSNLRTEGEHWNHLIVPRAFRFISGYQDKEALLDLVDCSNPSIQQGFLHYSFLDTKDKHHLIPAFELGRAIAQDPELSVTLLRDGQPVTLSPARSDPQFVEPPSWLLRKLMFFRPVTPDGSPYCGN